MKTETIKQTVRYFWKGLWVAALVLGLMSGNASALDVSSKEEAVKMAFSGADKIVKKRIRLTTPQRAAIGKLSTQVVRDKTMSFYSGIKGGQNMGYAVVERVTNRSWSISYMVVMNADGTVKDVEVLNYEGARNWGVQYESWLKQFFGMKADSDYRSISGITGATISVRTITAGVQKIAAAYQVIFLDKVE
ncbi:MAG: FMN-binding protein [Nitrospinota bacterium]|nr:FMN-binding protein [Nitrospinota bacterium]